MKKTKILHVTPNEKDDCGIAKYQMHYIDGMKDTVNKIFRPSIYKIRLMGKIEFRELKKQLIEELYKFDILHIQHELSLFQNNQFTEIVHTAQSVGKKVITTVHTSPSIAIQHPQLSGIGPRSFLRYARQKKNLKKFHKEHTEGFQHNDLLIVHNEETRDTLIELGVSKSNIDLITIPVPVIRTNIPDSTEIATKLNKQPGDIIYCTVGFVHRHKGVFEAVKALKFLPENYKLAVLGGIHSLSTDYEIYNELTDLIVELELQKRVFISGYVKSDHTLNSYIQECDICVYPYNFKGYYGSSSAAVNLALANRIPVVAYPIPSLKEINIEYKELVLCSTFSYYELAREIKRMDYQKQLKNVEGFAKAYAYPVLAKRVEEKYRKLATAKNV